MNPKHYKLYKFFESNLTKSEQVLFILTYIYFGSKQASLCARPCGTQQERSAPAAQQEKQIKGIIASRGEPQLNSWLARIVNAGLAMPRLRVPGL